MGWISGNTIIMIYPSAPYTKHKESSTIKSKTSLTSPEDCNQQNCGSSGQVLHHLLGIGQVAVELHHHAVGPKQHPLHYQPQSTTDGVGEEDQLKAGNVHHGPERNKLKEIPIQERAPL